ncbi:DUF402 domain-containing protein [Paenibacillus sp. FSL M7-1455]|uniref:DUF402 domain-containing protein n=1 Tax=Paenibacillus cookii TaxID=157839 RepID=A0ABQ4M2I0_9BACL|nr:DUF402 domain-containing protein [Paenibacillus cookii]GIO69348.1 hypothetical protein J21TS3_41690 [Paenibacillus cookii]
MPAQSLHKGQPVIERKIRYDATVAYHDCTLLKMELPKIVLLHQVDKPFTMPAGASELTIPEGTYTFAYYWIDRPYNLYFWRDGQGNYLGSYFNLVRNTTVTDEAVSFEDLIIDLLVLPNGEHFVLDEDELPEPLHQFENGFVHEALHALIGQKDAILEDAKKETERLGGEIDG